jgi:SsrA-binding protein
MPHGGRYTPRTMKPTGIKLIAQNKKAYHDYHIEETLEAGIVLTGTEVKSLREGRVNLRDSYAAIEKGELFLVGVHISPYTHGNIFNVDPIRTRKLLVHSRELRRLYGKAQVAGYTLVPTKMYFKDGRAKVEIALAKGKTLYDKRETLAKKEAQRDIERAIRSRERE